MTVTLFRNKVFGDVISLKGGPIRVGWVLKPMTGVLIRREDAGTHREGQQKEEAEVGATVMQLYAKEHRGMPAVGKGHVGASLEPSEGAWPC